MITSPGDGMSDYSNDRQHVSSNEELSHRDNGQPDASGDRLNAGQCKDAASTSDCCEEDSCRICCSIDSQVPWYEFYDCLPLNSAEVRWFRRDTAVSNSKWVPFNGFDSRKLECAYRRMNLSIKGSTKIKHETHCPLCYNNVINVDDKSSNTSLNSNKQCESQGKTAQADIIDDCMDVDFSDCSEEKSSIDKGHRVNEPMNGVEEQHVTLTPPPSPDDLSPCDNNIKNQEPYANEDILTSAASETHQFSVDEYPTNTHNDTMKRSTKSQNMLNLKLDISANKSLNAEQIDHQAETIQTTAGNKTAANQDHNNTTTGKQSTPNNHDKDDESVGDEGNSSKKWIVNLSCSLYQVDLESRVYSPIYWTDNEKTCTVIRGTWFLLPSWQPVEEEYADIIESEHLNMFSQTTHSASSSRTSTSHDNVSATSAQLDGPVLLQHESSSTTRSVTTTTVSSSTKSSTPPSSPRNDYVDAPSPPSSSTTPTNIPLNASTLFSSPPTPIASPASSPPSTSKHHSRGDSSSSAGLHGSPRANSQPPPQSPRPTSPSTTVIHNISLPDFHIDWMNEDEVYLHYETTSSKLYRVVGSKLGLSKVGTRLNRGYSEPACTDDHPCEVTHLIFVVHGIGQMMAANDIIKSCSELKESSTKMQEKFYPDLGKYYKQRIEFLPVEWRSSLKLDGGLVDSVTPVQLRGLRQMLNISALDILYYSSPLHRTEMIRGMRMELNRLYQKFCDMQPNFVEKGGKVSIVAHSLGCVIMYDILTQWNPLNIYDQCMNNLISESYTNGDSDEELLDELDKAKNRIIEIEKILKEKGKQRSLKLKLNFEVDKFFCLGSPLSVFLALRKSPVDDLLEPVKPVMPTDLKCRILNIYHPSDPISYRLEPLILNHYTKIKPLSIHQYDSKVKCPYDSMINETCPLGMLSKSDTANTNEVHSPLSPTTTSPLSSPPPEVDSQPTASWSSIFSWSRIISTPSEVTEPEFPVTSVIDLTTDGADNWLNLDSNSEENVIDLTSDSADMDEEPLEIKENYELPFRLDYTLRDSGTLGTAYLAALTAHISYWADRDVALFILMQCLGDQYPPCT